MVAQYIYDDIHSWCINSFRNGPIKKVTNEPTIKQYKPTNKHTNWGTYEPAN